MQAMHGTRRIASDCMTMLAAVRGRIVLLACALGCIAACLPASTFADVPEKVFTLTITRGAVPIAQRTMRVNKNDLVRWHITSDAPGEVHLHAYRVTAKLVAGAPADMAFKAFATGRFRLEWHADAARGASPGAHHAPPFATFEVRPN